MKYKDIIELNLDVQNEYVEPVTYLFNKHGDYNCVLFEEVTYNPDEGESKPTLDKVTVKGYIDKDNNKDRKIAFIEGGLSLNRLVSPVSELRIEEISHEKWTKQKFPPINIGENILITSDLKLDTKISKIIIKLTPGLGFGTGHHPTTKMMLEQLENHNLKNKEVLDFGCGSGILSIAAKMLGAKSILAIDIDELSIKAAKENIKNSEVRGIELYKQSIEDLSKKLLFDMILANISSNVISKSGIEIYERLKKDGLLICSGILTKDSLKIKKDMSSLGFSFIKEEIQGDWICLIFRK